MEIIDELARKAQRVAQEVADLRKEKQQLMTEIELMKVQVRDAHTIARENEKMKRDHEQIRARLQRLQRKIDKHLLVETTLASRFGGISEEHPQ